jgi:hypothetical protein
MCSYRLGKGSPEGLRYRDPVFEGLRCSDPVAAGFPPAVNDGCPVAQAFTPAVNAWQP